MPIEHYDVPADWPVEPIRDLIRELMRQVGEDPEREGVLDTPERVARMYAELTEGYRVDPEALVNDALFDVSYDQMVIVNEIEYYSLCEHHMLPFFGHAHVAYIPNGRVLGLSKIPRVVEMFARRMQIQERMTSQIADFLDELLHPIGVGVVIEGAHMCSMMRGIKKSNARMVTSAMRGKFKTNPQTRSEFLELISHAVAPQ